MKLDILVIAAHPDDAELGAGGSIAKAIKQGKKVGVLDLTRGELGTRGTPELRAMEAVAASKILGITVRDNVGLADGFFQNNEASQRAISKYLRLYRPEIVIGNAISDRHPDHGRAAKLVSDACFISGLRAVTVADGEGQPLEAWRPQAVYHYVQDVYIQPDFVVDITDEWDIKMKSILAYATQFNLEKHDDGPVTAISTPEFLKVVEARAREYGRLIGTTFGEGFTTERPIGLRDLGVLL